MIQRILNLVLAGWVVAVPWSFGQDLGVDRLRAEWGERLPRGDGLRVTQVEAETAAGLYGVDGDRLGRSDLEIVEHSGPSEEGSRHATAVARWWYGAAHGVSPAVSAVDLYECSHWMGEGFLRAGGAVWGPPAVEQNPIQCHSWVGRLAPDASLAGSVEVLRRFDYAIARDGFLAVVSLDNGAATPVPDLLAHSYNALVVGRADGNHSRGTTRYEGIGRLRPDVVGSLPSTSMNVPLVGGGAAILWGVAEQDPALAAARQGLVMKALLMAGASREPFPAWSATPDQPLDPVVGAGLLDLYNSVQILSFGRQAAGSGESVRPIGWDLRRVQGDLVQRYLWVVPEGTRLEQVSILLHWQRTIRDADPGPGFLPEPDVADLGLSLWRIGTDGQARLLDQSRSPNDNVELIARDGLGPGVYMVDVTAKSGGAEYALAWHSRPLRDASAL